MSLSLLVGTTVPHGENIGYSLRTIVIEQLGMSPIMTVPCDHILNGQDWNHFPRHIRSGCRYNLSDWIKDEEFPIAHSHHWKVKYWKRALLNLKNTCEVFYQKGEKSNRKRNLVSVSSLIRPEFLY